MDLISQSKIENVKMYDRLTSCVTCALNKSGATGGASQASSTGISAANTPVGIVSSSASSITSSQSINQYPAACGLLGTLYLTVTHLIFVDMDGKSETWLLHSHIASVDKLPPSVQGTPLLIKCKNFQVITFILPKEKDACSVSNSLYHLSHPVSYEDLYCFRYSASNEPFKNQKSRTWGKFDLLREFKRQGVPNKYWSVSCVNERYQLCETYPSYLLVPASSNESMLKSSAYFRSKCRLPVLTYRHSNDACICRCSQPLSGFSQRCEEDESLLNAILRTNCKSKVLYVVDTRPRVSAFFCYSWNQAVNVMLPELSRKLIKLSTSATPSATTSCYCSSSTPNSEWSNYSLYPLNPCDINALDRSHASTNKQLHHSSVKTNRKYSSYLTPHKKMNAYANRATGKGFENESFYENIKFNFFGIENIHVMRSSLAKLLEASELFHVSQDAFISAIESSGWLKHLKSLLEAASFVARAVTDGISVIVHCSDGWDRTAQTCSLAALLIDPYYRTIDGFQALIDKDWIAFGHKFSERCGHIQVSDAKEVAPVFTQFVDCVYQIQQQHPCEFEFNEKFLIFLHDHIYSCQFGNFIGNCDRDRTDMRISERSFSLWAYMDTQRDKLINALYYAKRSNKLSGCEDAKEAPINLDTSPQLIKYWAPFYNRFETGLHSRESVDELLLSSYNHIASLERHVKYLKRKISDQLTLNSKLNCSQQVEQTLPKMSQACPVSPSASEMAETCAIPSEPASVYPPTRPVAPLKSDKSVEQMEFLTIRDKASLAKLSDSSRGSSSFDSIDYPLKVVKECMQRLEAKAKLDQELAENRDTGDLSLSPLITDAYSQLPSQPAINSSQSLRSKLRLDELNIAHTLESPTTPTAKLPAAASASAKTVGHFKLDLNQLLSDIDTVAIHWQSSRNILFTECLCGGQPFDLFALKNHCYCCGKIYCARCTDRKLNLPALDDELSHDLITDTCNSDGSSDVFESPSSSLLESNHPYRPENHYIDPSYLYQVPVCRFCYKLLRERDSFTSPSVELNHKQQYSRNVCQS